MFKSSTCLAGGAFEHGAGKTIKASVKQPLIIFAVSQQALYTLGSNSEITGPDTSQGVAGQYTRLNHHGGPVMVGLAQLTKVNGQVSPTAIPCWPMP